ncbi:MAG: GNAT family N-acetyltransferase [Aridibacter sp.]
MSETRIRKANLDDADMLTELAYTTFYDAFQDYPQNAPEDMAAYMEEAFSLETISAELNEQDSIFLIAEIEGEAVGYAKVMFGSVEEEINAEKPVELNRLYAKQEFLGKGIGQKLMDECFEIAAENNCDVMWLGVWEYNLRAKRFYEKLGFYEVGSHVFLLGSDPQIDLLMQKEI